MRKPKGLCISIHFPRKLSRKTAGIFLIENESIELEPYGEFWQTGWICGEKVQISTEPIQK